jgi:uncharacterized SAM-binding protein YcdF (DUF218 family)
MMRKVTVALMLASAVLLVISTAALVREFSIRSQVFSDVTVLPTTAVVFTGQNDRIELALQLFDQGRLDRIFISGVNGGAGISVKNFAEQFQLSLNARAALDTGHIILATDANATIENALEAACWLDKQSNVREIVLIAGRYQMSRASWALESALSRPISVLRLSPEIPSTGDKQLRSKHARADEIRRHSAARFDSPSPVAGSAPKGL